MRRLLIFIHSLCLYLNTNHVSAWIWQRPTSWNMCYDVANVNDVAFLTLYKVTMKQCVNECHARRTKCVAVNYWRIRRVCNMFEQQAVATLTLKDVGKPCTTLSIATMTQHNACGSSGPSACGSCGINEFCNAENSTCIIKECPSRPVVSKGHFKGNVLSVGAHMALFCDEFYVPDPNVTQVECQTDGTWGTLPTCVPGEACGAPTPVPNATPGAIIGDILPGTQVTYTCDTGYAAPANNNNFLSICLDDATWSTAGFQCLIACGAPTPVPNATPGAIIGDILPGTQVTYTCDTGYAANNNNFLSTCLDDATWSPAGFQCLIDCNGPPPKAYVSIGPGGTLQGEVRTYTCASSYITQAGSNTISVTCEASGDWSTTSLSCIKDCGTPPAVSFASVDSGDTYEGSLRQYTCDVGYTVKTSTGYTAATTEDVTCASDGSWGVAFTCKPVCDPPPLEQDATAGSTAGDVLPGTTVTYSCNSGYGAPTNKNNFVLTCQVGGTWSTPGFECLIDCSSPPTNAVATLVTPGGTLLGTTRTYTCWNHYITPTGWTAITTTCEAGGTWSTPSESCLRDCGTPPAVTHATVNTGTTHEGSLRQYTCDTHYQVRTGTGAMAGTTSDVTCGSYGSWGVGFTCVLSCAFSGPLVSGANGIANDKITASSEYDSDAGDNRPYHARLDGPKAWGTEDAGSYDEYIQFDFTTERLFTSITTQGKMSPWGEHEWVTSYNVLYSSTCASSFEPVRTPTGSTQTFPGNTNNDGHVSNTFSPPFLAKCVRIHAQSWNNWIVMRVELYGC